MQTDVDDDCPICRVVRAGPDASAADLWATILVLDKALADAVKAERALDDAFRQLSQEEL